MIEEGDDEATILWLHDALERHGYLKDTDTDADPEDVENLMWDVVDDFFNAHQESMIPARTAESDKPIRAFEWFKSIGSTTQEYLAYLARQTMRADYRKMVAADPRKFGDDYCEIPMQNIATAQLIIAQINLQHPEEIDASTDVSPSPISSVN